VPLDWRASMFSVTTSWCGVGWYRARHCSDLGQPWLSGQDRPGGLVPAVTTETAVTWAASLVSCLPDLEAARSRLARGRLGNSRNL